MQVYRFNVPTFGKDVVFDVPHKVRAEQFKMFSEALKVSKMTDYVPLFEKEAKVSSFYLALMLPKDSLLICEHTTAFHLLLLVCQAPPPPPPPVFGKNTLICPVFHLCTLSSSNYLQLS